ncbi:MAG: M23 family metallopeptidase [bacterium]|nr:M23 family metallopeptidase [bacterium]
MRRTSLILLLLLVFPASDLQAEQQSPHSLEAAVAEIMESVHEALEHGRTGPELDPVLMREEIQGRLRARPTSESFKEWLDDRMNQSMYSFAPLGAIHDQSAAYGFPFDEATPRPMTSGPGDRLHQGKDWNAVDFGLPIGTPVLASRDGVVARVVDGYTEGGLEPRLEPRANTVLVLHADGSFAVYAHLSPGIPVSPGQQVRIGDWIGSSGNTGYSSGPHLHMAVYVLTANTRVESVPWVFADLRGSLSELVPGRLYPTQESRAAGQRDQLLDRGVDQAMDSVHRAVDAGQTGPEFDAEGVQAEIRRRIDRGEDTAAVSKWVVAEINTSLHSFAELDPVYDDRAIYRLPFEEATVTARPRMEKVIGQGRHRNAVGFRLPRQTRILASRSGTVERIVQRPERAKSPSSTSGHTVIVSHDDGSFCAYSKLSPDIDVSIGDWIEVGQVIGETGSTRDSESSEIHLTVYVKTSSGLDSIPITFGP